MLTEEEIERIVTSPSCRLKKWERDSAANFLCYIRDVVIPLEREESKYPALETQTSFEIMSDVVVQDPFWLSELLGCYWERQFCCLVSHWGYHTFRTQKYKVTGGGRLAIGDPKIDPSKDIKLPDILFAGEGRMGWCDVKHAKPYMKYPIYGVDEKNTTDWLKLLSLSPHLPVYYIIHFALPLDRVGFGWKEWEKYWWRHHSDEYNRVDMWSTEPQEEGWRGINITPKTVVRNLDDTKSVALEDYVQENQGQKSIWLGDFIPLQQLLAGAE